MINAVLLRLLYHFFTYVWQNRRILAKFLHSVKNVPSFSRIFVEIHEGVCYTVSKVHPRFTALQVLYNKTSGEQKYKPCKLNSVFIFDCMQKGEYYGHY
ncbi:MAG: hypothetical protein DBY45_05560 [Clostridiales bacterium]|nr:MAG: hypothetical protein DBY45_05560 [Clostridiales bacterium]